jgi:signal transduction histidine kinase
MTQPHTILVVDDEPDLVQSMKDLLSLEYRVLGSTRAGEGLRILDKEEVHVVMTDQRMPDMSGIEFLRRVREKSQDTIGLLLTGYADIKPVIDAINLGNVYRYITKPWDPEELLAILRQALERYDLRVERKRLIAELQVSNERLEKANEELRKANMLKEAFIRVASHELRTPLTILYGLTQLVLKEAEIKGPLKDWLTDIYKSSERLNRLVDQLIKMLAAGRFERPLVRQPVDLAGLLREAVQDVQPFIDQRRQQLVPALAPDLGTFPLDANKIRDSVDNLLLNAIKFTPDGGNIWLHARRTEEGAAEVRVTDSGVGIDPAHRQHLFTTFFTGFDVSRHASGQFEFGRRGLGLGLSLVKAFVEMHGGRVEVASSPGQGSTFTIVLPPSSAPP